MQRGNTAKEKFSGLAQPNYFLIQFPSYGYLERWFA
jgi:hypothetical protein